MKDFSSLLLLVKIPFPGFLAEDDLPGRPSVGDIDVSQSSLRVDLLGKRRTFSTFSKGSLRALSVRSLSPDS